MSFHLGAQGDGFLTEGAQALPCALTTALLSFTLDSGGTRTILIIGSTLMFFGVERRHKEIGEDGRKNLNLKCDVRCNFCHKK